MSGRSPLQMGVEQMPPTNARLHALGNIDTQKTQDELQLAQSELRNAQPRRTQGEIGLAQDVAGPIEAREFLGQREGEHAELVGRTPAVRRHHGIGQSPQQQGKRPLDVPGRQKAAGHVALLCRLAQQ